MKKNPQGRAPEQEGAEVSSAAGILKRDFRKEQGYCYLACKKHENSTRSSGTTTHPAPTACMIIQGVSSATAMVKRDLFYI